MAPGNAMLTTVAPIALCRLLKHFQYNNTLMMQEIHANPYAAERRLNNVNTNILPSKDEAYSHADTSVSVLNERK